MMRILDRAGTGKGSNEQMLIKVVLYKQGFVLVDAGRHQHTGLPLFIICTYAVDRINCSGGVNTTSPFSVPGKPLAEASLLETLLPGASPLYSSL